MSMNIFEKSLIRNKNLAKKYEFVSISLIVVFISNCE